MPTNLPQLFLASEDYFFRSLHIDFLDIDNTAAAYFTVKNDPNLNVVYIRKNITSIKELLDKCQLFYAQHGAPWMVIMPESYSSNTKEDELAHQGFFLKEKSIAMFTPLPIQSEFPSNECITIKEVSNDLSTWMLPLVGAFKTSFESAHEYAEAHAHALTKQACFYHFTAFVDDKPVSSLTLSKHSNLARIDDVGTEPSFQKRGYATALMRFALQKASDLKCDFCFLESSESGVSVYQKLGFDNLYVNNSYACNIEQ